MEIWKCIKGYENLYEISSYGNVKSLARIVYHKGKNQYYTKNEFIMRQSKRGDYLRVGLHKDGKCITFSVHRLVALNFIDNPNNLKTVNHINEIKTDNRVENLEWMSIKDNTTYSVGGAKNKQSKSILQFDENMNFIKEWNCIREAQRELGTKTIIQSLKNNYKSNGFYFKYKNN